MRMLRCIGDVYLNTEGILFVKMIGLKVVIMTMSGVPINYAECDNEEKANEVFKALIEELKR
jgi:hypothetical protein